ncbi:hypothetical protein GGF44_002953 [Coemansia sp. RSA 1694]|nr:hypothetical protein GGF38_002936 [Coemansia sp. RSA 25]KAJ2584665.1 hypothetical protein GGH95_000236 [Coemansia sp. RSA 1836]KAJ2637417.1 hypothetical protein GGF44_002953 [Coemansia sp. RSA 1694]
MASGTFRAGAELRSFGLTHFQYSDGDHVGMALALASLFPIFMIVMQVTIVLSRREVAGMLLLLGQLANEAFNLLLKQTIREDRPNLHLGDGYGMPSSHAQFMGFFVMYSFLYLETRITTNVWHKGAVQLGAVGLSVLVAASRVYLGYHSVPQVLAGAAVGLAAGLVWYLAVERVLYPSGLVEALLDTSVSRWLLLRDSRGVPDIALAEYRLSRNIGKQK